jgi:branched-chain amino acid transport system permease protein
MAKVWTIAVIVAGAVLLPFWISGYVLGLLTIGYYFGIFSMAWDLLFGFANEVNFGPTFLVGLGAYTAGILNSRYGVAIPVCILFGTLAAMAGGIALALPALRVSGPYFGLTTLVAVLLLQNLIVIFSSWTGGEIGLSVPDVLSLDNAHSYWIALVVMLASGIFLFVLSRSATGLILQASGQDPVQAKAMGFNVVKHKLVAFAVSAFFSGLSGSLFVFYLGSVSIGTLIEVTIGVQIIIAAVLGGRRTILGAAFGAIFLIALTEMLRPTGELATFIVSLAALLVVMLLPDGLLGTIGQARR